MSAVEVCPHETPGGPTRCAICRLDALADDFGPQAERIERYGRILRSRREHVEPVGSPMPDRVRAEIARVLNGGASASAPEQPAMFSDEAGDEA